MADGTWEPFVTLLIARITNSVMSMPSWRCSSSGSTRTTIGTNAAALQILNEKWRNDQNEDEFKFCLDLPCTSIHTLVLRSLWGEDSVHDKFYRIVRMRANDLRWHQGLGKFDNVDKIYTASQHEHRAAELRQYKIRDNGRHIANKSLNSKHRPIRNKNDNLCPQYLNKSTRQKFITKTRQSNVESNSQTSGTWPRCSLQKAVKFWIIWNPPEAATQGKWKYFGQDILQDMLAPNLLQ